VESRNEKRGVQKLQNTNLSLFRVQLAHTISHAEITEWIELSLHVKHCYVF